ncbi:MAG: secreted protein [Candidatus Magnetoglobus multicellularis str. Araruama]|uniref:Secreted protein n=1 Tax=Candidatus Magnetoglobus multicellularis str. Araruama TaxID=890399 RepID=A0A1V1P275_9BACT|nr:MAG: secreted protein [Candidatus Magnetoglobus multicellularis str. Araruama]
MKNFDNITKPFLIPILICMILLCSISSIYAINHNPVDQNYRRFSLYFENDAFANDDDQYTNGLKLTWSRYGLSRLPEDALFHRWLYPIARRIGFSHPESEKTLTFSIGQNIYTPNDIETSELIEDDRPYAGITYAEIGFHRKFQNQMHTFGFCFGIVGPHSYAKEVQTFVHDLLNHTRPNGWVHQLKDEPVFCIIYDYKRKIFAAGINDGFGGDVIINIGGGLGTARTFFNTGVSLRYGWNVPNDCGNFPIQPATCFNAELKGSSCYMRDKRLGGHLFTSFSGQAIGREIFLDGNLFRDSHNVDKKPVVGIFMGGVGIIWGKFKTVFAFVEHTRSFETQDESEVFGSINFSLDY